MKTITEVANQLGVQHWNIRHAIVAGYVSRPAKTFSGRMVFEEADIVGMKDYFQRREPIDTPLGEVLGE